MGGWVFKDNPVTNAGLTGPYLPLFAGAVWLYGGGRPPMNTVFTLEGSTITRCDRPRIRGSASFSMVVFVTMGAA